MRKILLGATIGAALASVAFITLDRSSRNGVTSVEGRSVAQRLPDSGADESPTRATSVEDQPSTIEEPEERPAEATRAREVARSVAETSPTLPLTLPLEFDWLRPRPDRTTHWSEWLPQEPIDPVWSAQAEADLNSYLATNPEIIAKYGFPTIDCRTSACVAAFVSYDPVLAESERPTDIGMTVFREENQGFFEGQWGEQFVDVFSAESRSRDGATTIAWVLRRCPDECQAYYAEFGSYTVEFGYRSR